MPAEKVRRHFEWSREVGTLDGGTEGFGGDALSGERVGLPPSDAVRERELQRVLDAALEDLPRRERRVVEDRFGLKEPGKVTRTELGRRMGISAERVRQLERRALRRMRNTIEESPSPFLALGEDAVASQDELH